MGRNKSVSLWNYFDDFVKLKITQGGRYKNAIQEGIDSGIAMDFNPKKHLDSLKAKMNPKSH